MSSAPPSRRFPRPAVLGVALAVLLGGGWALHSWAPGYAVRWVLGLAGASDVAYDAVRGGPWHLEVDNLSFFLRTQKFTAQRVVVDRDHWWSASLGRIRVTGAETALFLDGSDVDPLNWARYEKAPTLDEAVALPLETLDLDGRLVVRMSGVPDAALAVKVEGRPRTGSSWIGSLVAEGPGLRFAAGGSLLRAGQELDFQVLGAELDLAVWSAQVQRLVPLPGGPWAMQGKLTGVAEGRVTSSRFAATARVSLHEGALRSGERDLAATGIEADLEFSDLWKFRTRAAELRAAEFRVGRLRVTDLRATGGLAGARTLVVDGVRGRGLGGELGLNAFRAYLDQDDLLLSVNAEDLDAAQLARLVPAAAEFGLRARLDGTVAVRLQRFGARLDSGELHLRSADHAGLRLHPSAFVRAGALADEASLKVLRASGSDPAWLQLSDLRLALRPPEAPLGATARLDLAGELPAGSIRAKVYVNGPVESQVEVLP